MNVRLQHRLHIVGPDHIAWNPRLLLSFHIPVADVREPQRPVAAFAQDFRDRAAHDSESNQGNATLRIDVGSGFRRSLCGRFSQMISISLWKKDSLSYVRFALLGNCKPNPRAEWRVILNGAGFQAK
jgi:hypothetical protein